MRPESVNVEIARGPVEELLAELALQFLHGLRDRG